MVDFFEHCQLSNDVEFGGNDVLQVYNTAQVKHRLNTTGMYIASTKVTPSIRPFVRSFTLGARCNAQSDPWIKYLFLLECSKGDCKALL